MFITTYSLRCIPEMNLEPDLLKLMLVTGRTCVLIVLK